MKYEQIHTHRYAYRRMGLVPHKDQPRDTRPRRIMHEIVAWLAIIGFILLSALAS